MQVIWLPDPWKNTYFKLLLNLKTQCISVLQQKNISVTRPLEVVKERNETTGEESYCASPELQWHLLYLSSKSFLWNAQPSILVKPDLKLLENFLIFSGSYKLRKTFLSSFPFISMVRQTVPSAETSVICEKPYSSGIRTKGIRCQVRLWLCFLAM